MPRPDPPRQFSSTVPPPGTPRTAIFLYPGVCLDHPPVALDAEAVRNHEGRDDGLAEPQLASMTRSSSPVTGFLVNITPAATGSSSFWTTTPTLGRVNLPMRWRYVIAESEFADHHTWFTAELMSSAERTLSSVRCCPAKLASAPSSSTADERTASGPPSGRTHRTTSSSAESSPLATASTIVAAERDSGRNREPVPDRLTETDGLRAVKRFLAARPRAGRLDSTQHRHFALVAVDADAGAVFDAVGRRARADDAGDPYSRATIAECETADRRRRSRSHRAAATEMLKASVVDCVTSTSPFTIRPNSAGPAMSRAGPS